MTSEKHGKLKLVYPSFDATLAKTVFALQALRHPEKPSDVPPTVLGEIQKVFHLLETLASVRIEGNRTTLADAVDHAMTPASRKSNDDQLAEVDNIEAALRFVDDNMRAGTAISGAFIRKLHEIVVHGLSIDVGQGGDSTPGAYRERPIAIKNSEHRPPEGIAVPSLMEELVEFINQDTSAVPQADLLVVAIAHHRFTWIHPFHNGNGRVVRLLTYAMLLRQGYQQTSILNPSAAFCTDRGAYYDALATADTGGDANIVAWCEYMLSSLLREMERVDKLLDHGFLISKIIDPALQSAVGSGDISERERACLLETFSKGLLRARDAARVVEEEKPYVVSRLIANLKEKRMLTPLEQGKRIYRPLLRWNTLLRGVIGALRREGLIPEFDIS